MRHARELRARQGQFGFLRFHPLQHVVHLLALAAITGQVAQDADGGQIRRYNVDGEALTRAQQDIWGLNAIPDAPGHEIVLADSSPLTGFDRFNPVSIVSHSIAKHMQEVVLEALARQRPWAN